MPYKCRFCGGTYCGDHRLPENHDCVGLKNWNDPKGVFDSGFDDSVNDEGSGGGIAGRLNTTTGGPLGYFRGNMTFVFLGLMWLTFLSQLVVDFVLGLPGLANTLFVLRSDHIGFVWTWFTSVFAHGGFGHIAINSLVLYFFGPPVERRIGSGKFTALFLVAGAIAGLAQVGTALYMGQYSAVVGASGAIMAIMGVLTVLNPNLRVYLYFIIPMPLWLLTFGFALYSAFLASGDIGANQTAQLAHLAGLGIGLLYGLRVKRQGGRAPKQLQFGGGPGGPGGRRRF